ncbi:hypothetical protein [Marinifilum fragile]|uniref:hypothetical protein n=1 Tax=Marinifilum fragile TaxID=570161 RepID=UPI002AAA7FDE|nr:hypothetical protein [Marinifilum fragile]
MEIECVLGGFRVLGSAKNGIWDRMEAFLASKSRYASPFLLVEVGIATFLLC